MKMKDLLKIEKRLLLQFNGLPLQLRLMVANAYNALIQTAEDNLDTNGEEAELFYLMEDLLNEYQDIGTGG